MAVRYQPLLKIIESNAKAHSIQKEIKNLEDPKVAYLGSQHFLAFKSKSTLPIRGQNTENLSCVFISHEYIKDKIGQHILDSSKTCCSLDQQYITNTFTVESVAQAIQDAAKSSNCVHHM